MMRKTSLFRLLAGLVLGTMPLWSAHAAVLRGNVFEDVSYAGGAGRSKVASSGVNRSSVRMELYTASGNFSTSTTTDANGNYQFTVSNNTSYTIRVVNSSVTSSLGGTGLWPVQTFRTTATSGAAVAVTDRVGGEDPARVDAGNGGAGITLASLSTATQTPQSITAVTSGTGTTTGLDFGFNFGTIVNTANTGQGSLRQFITNANALSGAQTSVFMISDGAAHPGLRAGLTSQLTSGVAVITLTSALPQITGALTLDGTSQTTNVGDTNSGTLGVGGAVGVDALTLPTVNRPEVELSVPSSINRGLDLDANDVVIRGFAIHGAGNGTNQNRASVYVASGTGITITQCIVGGTATALAEPAVNPSASAGIVGASGTTATVSNNLIGFTGLRGLSLLAGATGWQITANEVRGCGTAGASRNGGLELLGTGHTISGNLLIANKAQGIDVRTDNNGSQTIVNNTVTGNGVGANGTRETAGIDVVSDNNLIERNVITANFGAGVMIGTSGSGNRITRNAIYANGTITNDGGVGPSGQIGIDLLSNADNANQGTAPYVSLNDSGDGDAGGNGRCNTPVIDTATIVGANLELTGWITAGATAEFFLSDEHASGFGSGQVFLASFVEGGAGDLDPTTGSYSGLVNCFNQGADTNVARFKFVFARPAGVVADSQLTATATSPSNNTSEFCGNTTVYTNLPDFTVVQSSTTISDPINAASNPKAIPGSIAEYTVVITNTNAAISDVDTFVFTQPVPANAALFVGDLAAPGAGPVAFVDGATASGLGYSFTSLASATDDLEFSRDGGATWTYVPTPDADRCDAAVTHVRLKLTGAFAKAACGNTPSCTVRFRVRVN